METQTKKTYRVIIIFVICFVVLFASADIAARIWVPKLLEGKITLLLGVPAHVEKAGINFLNASFWMQDFKIENLSDLEEREFLSFKRMSMNFSFTSLLARQLIFEKIQFRELVLHIEKDANGITNWERFHRNLKERFKPRFRLGAAHFFTGYEIHQFSIKNGTFRYADYSTQEERAWSFHHLDFSFSNFAYPPQIIDPVPTSAFFSAKTDGVREGSILILGSGNFFAGKKNFRVRSDFKNIMLRGMNGLFPEFPLVMADGYLDLKSVLECYDDSLKIANDASVLDLKLSEKSNKSKVKTVFGFQKKDVMELFQNMAGRPFNFSFEVSGDIGDPKFNLEQLIKNKFSSAIEEQIERLSEKYSEKSLRIVMNKPVRSSEKPSTSLKQAFEQWTGIKVS